MESRVCEASWRSSDSGEGAVNGNSAIVGFSGLSGALNCVLE